MPKDPIQHADKIYHAGAFALLSFLFAYGFKKQFSFASFRKYAMVISIILSSALGGLIEILQHHFVKNRFGDWMDFVFDVTGAMVGIIILFLLCRYLNNRTENQAR
jgi:VanZ family protein